MLDSKREKIALCIILIISLAIGIPQYLNAVEAKKPNHSSDGWSTLTPELAGMNEDLLIDACRFLKKTDATCFMVIRHGQIVVEKYYRGQRPTDFSFAYSITNSYLSALIGIAVDMGIIKSIDNSVAQYFPEYFDIETNPQMESITIKHLLTMTSGISSVPEELFHTTDWVQNFLRLPFDSQPGSSFKYDAGITHLLSGIITKASGIKAADFSRKHLLEPLGVSGIIWHAGPKGYNIGGEFLYMKPQDIAKFGVLYANEGVWNGIQVISNEWIFESLSPQIDLLSVESDAPFKACTGFGYNFMLCDEGDFPYYFAEGKGTVPNLCIIPELDMVVVVTSYHSMFKKEFTYEKFQTLLKEYVFASVIDSSGGQ